MQYEVNNGCNIVYFFGVMLGGLGGVLGAVAGREFEGTDGYVPFVLVLLGAGLGLGTGVGGSIGSANDALWQGGKIGAIIGGSIGLVSSILCCVYDSKRLKEDEIKRKKVRDAVLYSLEKVINSSSEIAEYKKIAKMFGNSYMIDSQINRIRFCLSSYSTNKKGYELEKCVKERMLDYMRSEFGSPADYKNKLQVEKNDSEKRKKQQAEALLFITGTTKNETAKGIQGKSCIICISRPIRKLRRRIYRKVWCSGFGYSTWFYHYSWKSL
jgi:hypothetical protein